MGEPRQGNPEQGISPSPSRYVTLVNDGFVANIHINEPNKKVNTLSNRMLDDLTFVLDETERNPPRQCVVLQSDKPDQFVAGADLRELASIPVQATDAVFSLSRKGQQLFRRWCDFLVPVIAIVHGPCLGGGIELVLRTDWIIAVDSPTTRLGLPEITLNLIPGWGGTQRLAERVGLEMAFHLLLSGRAVEASEALETGLVDQMVQPSDLPSVLIEKIQNPPTKRDWTRPKLSDTTLTLLDNPRRENAVAERFADFLFESWNLPESDALSAESSLFSELMAEPASRAAIGNVLEKRKSSS